VTAAPAAFATSGGSGAYPRHEQYFCPSLSAHLRKSTIVRASCLSCGFSYNNSHVNDAIGYAPFPGGLVIDTRRSGGIGTCAASATEPTVALTNSPAGFCTAPHAM